MKELTPNERASAESALDAILDDCPPFTRPLTPLELANVYRTIVDLRDGWVGVGRSDAIAEVKVAVEDVMGATMKSLTATIDSVRSR